MTSPIFYQRPRDQGFKQFLGNANATIKELKDDGYRISASCRFSIFIKKFSEFLEDGFGLGERQYDIALLAEGLRDFAELEALVKSEKIRKENRIEIQTILGGAGKPSDDILTRSRDIQFQLFLAAIFDLAGFRVDNLEPDFTFKYKNATYAVAAKRINSENKIHARFSKARKQINKSGINGFIAFSLDRIVWDKINMDAYIISNNPDTLYTAGQTILCNLLQTKVRRAAWDNRDPLVVGHIASLTIPAIIPKLLSFGFASTQLFIPAFDVPEESIIYHHVKELPEKINWPPINK